MDVLQGICVTYVNFFFVFEGINYNLNQIPNLKIIVPYDVHTGLITCQSPNYMHVELYAFCHAILLFPSMT